jgi:heterodisulfide reductase subunit D
MGILNWLGNIGKNTLYYPGCLTKGVLQKEFDNYKKVLNKLGVDYILLSDKEFCCSLPVLNAGYRKQAKKLAEKNLELFKKHNITKIITNCPSCYHTFKEIYPTLIKKWDIEVEHITITVLKALKRKNIAFNDSKKEREIVTYHDPCHLGRHEGIYEEPREVIKLLGGKIKEFKYNRKNAMCCGGGGGLRANNPKLAISIANKKAQHAPKDAEKIISPCGLCYANIKSASNKSEEFSSFVLRKLGELK